MPMTINAGTDYDIVRIAGLTTTDVAVNTPGKRTISILIRSNTEDGNIEIRKTANATDYFTVPYGQAVTLDFYSRNETPCYIRASTIAVDAELFIQYE